MNIVEEYQCKNGAEGIEFDYFYRLIKSDYKGMTVYGIEIERKDYVGVKNINIERDKISMVSYKKYKVIKILEKLYRNKLSPIHLIDVIGCYADEFSYKAAF